MCIIKLSDAKIINNYNVYLLDANLFIEVTRSQYYYLTFFIYIFLWHKRVTRIFYFQSIISVLIFEI